MQHSRVEDLMRLMYTDATGVYRLHSNGRVPPTEIIEQLGLSPDDILRHDAARHTEQEAIIARYIRSRANYLSDQIADDRARARAEHGPGVALVNLLTGESYTT